MFKSKSLMVMLLVAVIAFTFAFTCYANQITVSKVSFEKYIDENGNEDADKIAMIIEFNAPENTDQITICVYAEETADASQAISNGTLIYINQFDMPTDNTLRFPISKSAILTATGAETVNGVKLYFTLGGTLLPKATPGQSTVNLPVPGDVTGDGNVNRMDLLRLGKYFSGWEVEINMDGSDVTGDGNVNRMDLLRLGKYFSGWDVTLGK